MYPRPGGGIVDALASGASGRKVVEVRVFSWAPLSPNSVVQVPDFQAFWFDVRKCEPNCDPKSRLSYSP